jgi:hypothetical protein
MKVALYIVASVASLVMAAPDRCVPQQGARLEDVRPLSGSFTSSCGVTGQYVAGERRLVSFVNVSLQNHRSF